MALLSVDDLSFAYRDRTVLSRISFSVDAGEVLGLVGPNGCGKTTLIKCVDGMLSPQEGKVVLGGRDLGGMHRREVARAMAYVPQSAGNQTASTVFETVLMGRRPYLNWTVSPGDEERVAAALDLLDLGGLAFRKVAELSGGERQRVMIARALVQETGVILLDEPTSNLDIRHQMAVMEVLSRSCRRERVLRSSSRSMTSTSRQPTATASWFLRKDRSTATGRRRRFSPRRCSEASTGSRRW
ncbi:ABC transporter ATP-binding protein [Methanoculleus sp. UBA413]|uniref:ABC transporter ATP-binding protein n=1 Tax=Methanoculleus sp. UBA413 TaxID=1915509 RepID=UPI002579E446|nr:ABC transporter ATP-binding protein [Methanoculleus sp. UBA413]